MYEIRHVSYMYVIRSVCAFVPVMYDTSVYHICEHVYSDLSFVIMLMCY